MDVKLKKIDQHRWKIEKAGKMRTHGIIYSNDTMIEDVKRDNGPVQVANVAMLPGIVGPSLAMPDIHWGYGFPIGGVAAFDVDTGVISPGGVGYDINCGVRLLRSELQVSEVIPKVKDLTIELFHTIPSGVGSAGRMRLRGKEEMDVLREGAAWVVKNGHGTEGDLVRTEDGGRMEGADPGVLSERALERGRDQLGTLGSGNHFIEVGFVDEIYDEAAANTFGLFVDGVVVQIHSGSRGLGYQVCDDFLKKIGRVTIDEGIEIPDRQLACAPIRSGAGRDYLAAMACAANYAWANRQVMSSFTREVFERFFNASPKDLRMGLVYDVCHNIARIEKHEVEGKERELCVHRKGATRALPPGHGLVPEVYREVGQPILIPGDMGTASYVLVGTEGALKETFGSTCHGAGRVMSRKQAKRVARGRSIAQELMDGGVFVTARGKTSLAEEMPEAYKDVDDVVEVAHSAGISKKVARLRPIGVMKG